MDSNRTLVVLDLNSIIRRVHHSKATHQRTPTFVTPNGYHVFCRPFVKTFVRFLFKHFDVAIWTCMTKQNTQFVLQQLMTRKQQESLRFVYTQRECKKTHVNGREKPTFHKCVSKLPCPTQDFVFIENSKYTTLYPKLYSNNLVNLRNILYTYLDSDSKISQPPVSKFAGIFRFFRSLISFKKDSLIHG